MAQRSYFSGVMIGLGQSGIIGESTPVLRVMPGVPVEVLSLAVIGGSIILGVMQTRLLDRLFCKLTADRDAPARIRWPERVPLALTLVAGAFWAFAIGFLPVALCYRWGCTALAAGLTLSLPPGMYFMKCGLLYLLSGKKEEERADSAC